MAGEHPHVESVPGTLEEADLAAVRTLVAGRGAAEVLGATVPDDVICVVRAEDGTLTGASTAVAADVELVGGRRFLVYGSVLATEAAEAADALLSATFAALDAAFDQAPGAPIGLCVLVAGEAEMARRPEARWDDPPMLYVGYLGDRRQVRVGYFAGALIAPPVGRG